MTGTLEMVAASTQIFSVKTYIQDRGRREVRRITWKKKTMMKEEEEVV